jgi:plastocyanin
METHAIEITAMSFHANTPVERGDTVVSTNRMNMNHTVTADNGEFDGGVLGKNKSFSHLFDAVGAVAYHCEFHPNMTGTHPRRAEKHAKNSVYSRDRAAVLVRVR